MKEVTLILSGEKRRNMENYRYRFTFLELERASKSTFTEKKKKKNTSLRAEAFAQGHTQEPVLDRNKPDPGLLTFTQLRAPAALYSSSQNSPCKKPNHRKPKARSSR